MGQCHLKKVGGNVVLTPFNGNQLFIYDFAQAIPGADVSRAATGLTPGTLFSIHAYMNSGVMTLEASTTGHVTDAVSGIEIKFGDAARSGRHGAADPA